jgi:hypothetical protein
MKTLGWGPPSDLFLNPFKWQVLADELEGRSRRDATTKATAGYFGFPAISLVTSAGEIPVWASNYTPIDACYAPNFKYVALGTPDGRAGFPKIMNGDGQTLLRNATDDGYEVRLVCYPGHLIRAPGSCGRCPV